MVPHEPVLAEREELCVVAEDRGGGGRAPTGLGPVVELEKQLVSRVVKVDLP